MTNRTYDEIEAIMLSHMRDSAHDAQHVYRVLYLALDIAAYESGVDIDVLIAACLLHDIGRARQAQDPTLCHAEVGSVMAHAALLALGWDEKAAQRVQHCVACHRKRRGNEPQTLEAKILFDADKLDVGGALGVARTLIYCGQILEPLYRYDGDRLVEEGGGEEVSTFLQEFAYLQRVFDRLYTRRAEEIASQRHETARWYRDRLVEEIDFAHRVGRARLREALADQ